MTTPSKDDFKLSDDDRLFKRPDAMLSTAIAKKNGSRIKFILILISLIILFINQAWFHWIRHQDQTADKISQLQSTIDHARSLVSRVDQQLSNKLSQDTAQLSTQLSTQLTAQLSEQLSAQFSAQLKALTEKISQLEQAQLNQAQALATQALTTQASTTQASTTQDSVVKSVEALATEVASLANEQQTLRTQLDSLNEQVLAIKTGLDEQKIIEAQLKEEFKRFEVNVQDLTLQVATLATLTESLPPSVEADQSDALYRQQVNQRLDQLTETLRQLRYPSANP